MKDIILKLSDLGCSDIHIQSGRPIYYRYLGKIYGIEKSISESDIRDFLSEIDYLAEDSEDLKEIDASFSIKNFRYRMNIYKFDSGISLAIRILSNKIQTIEDLGLPHSLKKISNMKGGLVIVTGPTGSGKSTTLAAIIDNINRTQRKHIITIEDPIEYIHENIGSIITQRQVGKDTIAFENALRASLRQDPDIILIGEMRDIETVKTALEAAETGHLVLSTMHTKSASETVSRIIDMFSNDQKEAIRAQLAQVLNLVFAQSLILDKNEEKRIPLYEMMVTNSAIKNLIRDGKYHQIDNVIETSSSDGCISIESVKRKLKIIG